MREIATGKPDDMHLHLRDDDMLARVMKYTSSVFPRGIVMGNLPEPILTASDADSYKQRILSVDPKFNPLMTIMLRKNTTPEIIREAYSAGIRFVKYMPDASTTNSGGGIHLYELLSNHSHLLEEIQDLGMFLLGHWTLPGSGFNLERELAEERMAIPLLLSIVQKFPRLNITVEHVSTAAMIEFVESAPDNVVATITCHHAACDIRDLATLSLSKINNPYYYCKPILNTPMDSLIVRGAMLSGNPKFFFGSDSAPHPISAKKGQNPAAGIFSAPVALPILCWMFETAGKLENGLNNFVSRFGAEAYDLPLNEGEIILRKDPWVVPHEIEGIGAFCRGRSMDWYVV